jgi:hypothetical protein
MTSRVRGIAIGVTESDSCVVCTVTRGGKATFETYPTVEAALASKPKGEIRVAWNGPTQIETVTLPEGKLPASVLRLAVLGGRSQTASARVSEAGATAFDIPADALDAVWAPGSKSKAVAFVASALLTDDGLYLLSGSAGSQVVLVENGAAVLSRFVANETLAADVRDTADFWTRKGHAIPASANPADSTLSAQIIKVSAEDPTIPGWDLSQVGFEVEILQAPEGGGTSWLAWKVASASLSGQPALQIENPHEVEKQAGVTGRAKKAGKIMVALAVLATGATAYVYPTRAATHELDAMTTSVAEANGVMKSLAKEVKLKEEVTTYSALLSSSVQSELDWSTLYTVLLNSAPEGSNPKFGSFTVSTDQSAVTVVFSAKLTGGDFEATVSKWTENLTALGAKRPWPSAFSKEDAGTVSVSFTAPFVLSATDPLTAKFMSERSKEKVTK